MKEKFCGQVKHMHYVAVKYIMHMHQSSSAGETQRKL